MFARSNGVQACPLLSGPGLRSRLLTGDAGGYPDNQIPGCHPWSGDDAEIRTTYARATGGVQGGGEVQAGG